MSRVGVPSGITRPGSVTARRPPDMWLDRLIRYRTHEMGVQRRAGTFHSQS